MKKTRLLALMLVVSIMLMGAGYAFWTEALAIEGTVDTGELNFAFTGEEFTGGEYVTGSATVTDEDHVLNLEFINMHPGSTAEVKFCIANTGTIGLKIDDFVFTGDDDNLDQMYVEFEGGKISIEEFFEKLQGLAIDVEGKECVKATFGVKKCATEEDFKELADFKFSVNAVVKQYNDNGECAPVDPEEPEVPVDPECTGLRWVGDLKKQNRNYYLRGIVYVQYDNDTEVSHEINEELKEGRSITKTYCGFSIKFKNDDGKLIVYQ